MLDARIPISSQNPNIAEITKGKKKIIILNICDLADEKENQKWINFFKKKGIEAILTDANSGKGIEQISKTVEKVIFDRIEARELARKACLDIITV